MDDKISKTQLLVVIKKIKELMLDFDTIYSESLTLDQLKEYANTLTEINTISNQCENKTDIVKYFKQYSIFKEKLCEIENELFCTVTFIKHS